MTPDELLKQVERLLNSKFRSYGGKGHYRTVSLGGERTLGVDVFRRKDLIGHVRVHAFNISQTEANTLIRAEKSLQKPSAPKCKKCQNIPSHFPAWYRGPDKKQREYFGFQWHSQTLSERDLETIKQRIEWLRKLFPA
jgi:hypothetical protein